MRARQRAEVETTCGEMSDAAALLGHGLQPHLGDVAAPGYVYGLKVRESVEGKLYVHPGNMVQLYLVFCLKTHET